MVRFITVLAPVVILTIWGSSYVWSCVLALSAPSKPVEFKYKSKSGILVLHARSYAIDWDHGTAHVERPEIYGPDGKLLATAAHVDAMGISLPSPGSIVVHVRDVKATLTRLSSGRFDIQDFLPERQGPPSNIPFAVSVNEADVDIVDHAGNTSYRQPAIARDSEVRGVGEAWIANAAVELPGTGALRAQVQSLPNEGFLVRGTTAGLQLAPLLEHLKKTPDVQNAEFLKSFRADSLEAIGPVSVFVPKEKALQVETRIKAIAKNVRYGDYAADQAFFDGQVNEHEAIGQLDARYGSTKAKFHGSLVWRGDIALGGQLVVETSSSGGLPPWARKLIPADLSFANGRMDGWLDYRKNAGVRVEGLVAASQASIYKQSIDQPKISLSAGSEEVRLGIQSGRWAGTPVQGAVVVGIKSPTLVGAVTANSVNLATVASRFGARGLAGKAQVSVLLSGTRTHPSAILQASGNGSYRVQGKLITGRFQAAGDYSGDQVNVERFRVGTNAGSARAIGTLSLRKRTLALKVDATNIQLQKLRDGLAGTMSASGLVNGNFSNPQFNGHALALGIRAGGQEVPFASALVKADKSRLIANDLQVVKGTGQATGDVALNWKTHGISGTLSANNVLLNEYLGQEALGTVTVPKLTLGGTFEDPRAAGTAYGDDLLFGGIRVDHAEIASTMKGSVINLDNLLAKIGEGSISGSGKYDYSKKTGTFSVKGENLALQRVTPPGKGSANVTGTVGGDALVSISPSGTLRGKAKGSLQNVNLNDTDFGNGTWNLAYDGIELTGDASIGRLDRFFLLENVDYNTKAETIAAQVSILNGSLHDLYTSTRPFFPDLSFDVRQRLDVLAGDLDTTVGFSGPARNPNIDVKLLDAHNLALGEEKLGSLQAVLSKADTLWSIDSVKWTGPLDTAGMQGAMVLNKGFIDTNGDIRLDGEVSDFNLKYIGLIDQSWARLQGFASLSFLATGRTESPTIRASLESTKGSSFTLGGTGESFSVDLHTIEISQALYGPDGSYTGGFSAQGKFYYQELTGDIQAHLPLNYPLEIPDGPPISASLTFPNVDIKDLAKYADALDLARSSGSLQGSISIIGPKSNLALAGSLLGQADTIALNGIQTTLNATVASVKLESNKILLSFNAQSSAGGLLQANLTSTVPDLPKALDQIAKGDTDSLLHTPVEGDITVTDFAIRQDSKNKDFGTYHAKINSKLTVSGPGVEPLVKGRVGVSDTNILLPSVFEGAGPSAEMLFNPRFEIPIELDGVARFRTSTADVSLTGGGLLNGSLAQPSFNGSLTLVNGRLNLPTARVTLEEGGTLRPSYSITSSGEANGRVDVNLEGRTAVTALRYGDTVQRYDVRLYITGDLLSDGGLNLNATSDPPDLSKDEILALLGQTDVLKSIGSGSGFSQSETEKRIRDALVSIAVPTLTQSITQQFASGLGLEYLNVDYNPIEGASLSFAKVLGKGLILQGRRQISPTIGNRKVDYDLRLTYRLPTRNVALSRTVFSIGLDQDRPWKLGIEYGFRF